MQSDQDDNQSEINRRQIIEISDDQRNSEIKSTVVDGEPVKQEPLISQREYNMLLSGLVVKSGIQWSGFRCEYNAPWKDHILKTNSVSARLLTSLARILLRESHRGCACVKLEKTKIQVTLSGKVSSNYDSKIQTALEELATTTHQLHSGMTGEEDLSREQLIAKIKKRWRELIKRAVFKDKNNSLLTQDNEQKKQKKAKSNQDSEEKEGNKAKSNKKKSEIVRLIGTDGDKELRESFSSFEKAMQNFCENCDKKEASEKEIMILLREYQNYCLCLRAVHREKKEARIDSEKSTKVTNFVHKILFLPFLNLYDVITLFKYAHENHSRWAELSSVIKEKENWEVISQEEEGKHAEVKMLEANGYNVKIFTEGTWNGWRAVITNNFCVGCWTLCCACAEGTEEEDRLENDFGGSGALYKKWKVPNGGEPSREKKEQTKRKYLELIEGYNREIAQTGNGPPVGKEKGLENNMEEITAVYQVVEERNNELVLVEEFAGEAFWSWNRTG